MAVGLSCAATGMDAAVDLLQPLLTDAVDFVRQGALIATALVLVQAPHHKEQVRPSACAPTAGRFLSGIMPCCFTETMTVAATLLVTRARLVAVLCLRPTHVHARCRAFQSSWPRWRRTNTRRPWAAWAPSWPSAYWTRAAATPPSACAQPLAISGALFRSQLRLTPLHALDAGAYRHTFN